LRLWIRKRDIISVGIALLVFATANEINRLSKPLQSRFRKLFLPRYTEEQFLDVSEKVLSKTSPSIARYIAANVWMNGGDIRDVVSIGEVSQEVGRSRAHRDDNGDYDKIWI
jgi:ATP-dependent Lon protease